MSGHGTQEERDIQEAALQKVVKVLHTKDLWRIPPGKMGKRAMACELCIPALEEFTSRRRWKICGLQIGYI